MMDINKTDWSAQVLHRIHNRDEAEAYRDMQLKTDNQTKLEESDAKALAASFAE